MEFFEDQPTISIDPMEYVRLLGYPVGHQMDERPQELADMTAKWYAKLGRPWAYVRQATQFNLSDSSFSINNETFYSEAVLDRFHKGRVEQVIFAAVSAGPECENQARLLWEQSKPDEYFFMEMYGSAVVEHLIMQIASRICSWADSLGMAVLPHYSPGYHNWDIRDQLKLIELIREGNTTGAVLRVESLDSGMLKPKKSLLAIFGVTKHHSKLGLHPNMVPCERCALKDCQYRRKPYLFRPNAKNITSTP